MELARWYVLIGGLLIVLVIASGTLRRLPISTAMLYLAIGWVTGKLGWIALDAAGHARLLEVATEIALIVSLFAAGLKLRRPLSSRLWRLPVALAFGAMALTVGLVALAGSLWLGLPLGAAVILGAVLAPTDPVLAAEVQVEDPNDIDRLRFTLTGEAGLNDGTAFPFVMLGLGLLGLHELGSHGLRWWTLDVAWGIGGGLGIGALLGMAVGRLVVYLRRAHKEAVGFDDFLALGLIAAAYGLALAVHAYGFLAVFAAGLALRSVERDLSGDPEKTEVTSELSLMLITGALFAAVQLSPAAIGFAILLICVLRPLAAAPLCLAAGMDARQSALASWFGIRGIGSLYYLFYCINKGLAEGLARLLMEVVLCVIATSVIVHGLSVTPLMMRYQASRRRAPRGR